MSLLRRGIHVLVEKPLAATAAEAEALVETARRAGLVLQTGHIERFNPVLVQARPHLAGLRWLHATRHGPFTFRSTDVGAVLDLMIHDIDLALWLVGRRVRHVEASGFSVLGRHEDIAVARLVFDGGAVATLRASRVAPTTERKLEAVGSCGMIAIDLGQRTADAVGMAAQVRQGQFDAESLSADQRAALKDRVFSELLPLAHLASPQANPLADELADFAAAIRERRDPRVTGEDGAAALAVAERVLQAMTIQRLGAADVNAIAKTDAGGDAIRNAESDAEYDPHGDAPDTESDAPILRPNTWHQAPAPPRREAG
jgi:predicted dehydrogenase